MGTETEQAPSIADQGGLAVQVDGRQHRVMDPVMTGRQLLELAGRRPAEEHLVYWMGPGNVLEDLGLDETVDVREPGVERFLTFRGDRSFRFELDGVRQDWGAPAISESTLRKLARVDADHRVWLERRGEPDELVESGAMVDLTAPGVERFYTARATTVTVVNEDNGDEFTLSAGAGTPLSVLVGRMYKRLGVERKPDDRLRCESGGGDVFAFAQLTLGQYVEAGHCPCLVWLFAGGTGGATWR